MRAWGAFGPKKKESRNPVNKIDCLSWYVVGGVRTNEQLCGMTYVLRVIHAPNKICTHIHTYTHYHKQIHAHLGTFNPQQLCCLPKCIARGGGGDNGGSIVAAAAVVVVEWFNQWQRIEWMDNFHFAALLRTEEVVAELATTQRFTTGEGYLT